MNSVTHGLGIFLAMLAATALMKRTEGRPAHSIAACSVYSVSLLFLYTCSTLYHSFFALRTTHFIFGIIDKCAIYILIAGSYTPYLAIGLGNKPIWSVYLLIFIWLCCFFGICVEAFFQTWKRKGQFSLAMYLGMGWACLVCIPDLIVAIPKEAFTLLVMGGVGYTAGVPFFVRNTNLDHSIWHMFVLMASMFHWLGVYSYVVFL
jgi:hemolysin III